MDRLDLVEGTYKLDVAVHKLDGYPYDYHRLLYTFRVKSRTKDVGIYRPPHTLELLGRPSSSPRRKTRRHDAGRSDGAARQKPRAGALRGLRQGGRRGSCSPTACSTSFTPGTSVTCSSARALGDVADHRSQRRRLGPSQQGTASSDQRRAGARRDPRRARLRRLRGDLRRRHAGRDHQGDSARHSGQGRRLGRRRHRRPRHRRGARRTGWCEFRSNRDFRRPR